MIFEVVGIPLYFFSLDRCQYEERRAKDLFLGVSHMQEENPVKGIEKDRLVR